MKRKNDHFNFDFWHYFTKGDWVQGWKLIFSPDTDENCSANIPTLGFWVSKQNTKNRHLNITKYFRRNRHYKACKEAGDRWPHIFEGACMHHTGSVSKSQIPKLNKSWIPERSSCKYLTILCIFSTNKFTNHCNTDWPVALFRITRAHRAWTNAIFAISATQLESQVILIFDHV